MCEAPLGEGGNWRLWHAQEYWVGADVDSQWRVGVS
jgi:hypothetical protein